MKVYIVMRSEGEMGDYSESVEAVFADKEKAETFAKNKSWDFVKNQPKIFGTDFWVDNAYEVIE